jgi:hypothetical protein
MGMTSQEDGEELALTFKTVQRIKSIALITISKEKKKEAVNCHRCYSQFQVR